jgi:hypothetical protein
MRICRNCKQEESDIKKFEKTVPRCLECRRQYIKAWRHKRGENKTFKGQPVVDYSGTRFNHLVVIKLGGKNKFGYFWFCKCDCGKEISVLSSHLKRIKSCGCQGNFRHKNVWKGVGEISAVRFDLIKNRAKRIGLDFDLDLEFLWKKYLSQDKKCALTGKEIAFGKLKTDKWTASLDRIDSSKGYTKDNVQWVHIKINYMKSNLPQEEFIEWCNLVSKLAKKE